MNTFKLIVLWCIALLVLGSIIFVEGKQANNVQALCLSNAMCSQGEFCDAFVPGCTQPRGSCTQPPTLCSAIYDPVCGCDGMTYSNSCYRKMAMVSLDYTGPC